MSQTFKFCHNCGSKQASLVAKFCSACGTSLSSLSSTPTPPAQSTPQQPSFTPFSPNQDEDDDEIRADRLKHLDVRLQGLEFEIRGGHPVKETVGTMVTQGQMGVTPTAPSNKSVPVVDEKQFMEEFRREAGTTHVSPRDR